MRKIILSVFAGTSLLLYSTQAFALFNLSAGIPLSHSFSDSNVAMINLVNIIKKLSFTFIFEAI